MVVKRCQFICKAYFSDIAADIMDITKKVTQVRQGRDTGISPRVMSSASDNRREKQ